MPLGRVPVRCGAWCARLRAVVMCAPHGHGIREQNPAAGDATLSAACLSESGMTPCRAVKARHAGDARTAPQAPGEARSHATRLSGKNLSH